MKTNLFVTMAASLLIAGAAMTSCDQDVECTKFTPEAGENYSFSTKGTKFEVGASDNGVVKIPVYRGTTSGEESVALTAEMDEDVAEVFSLASTNLTFADGEGVAYAQLRFGSVDNLEATGVYEITLKLAEGVISVSGVGETTVTVSRKLTWEYIGDGHYTSQLFEEDWDQPVYKAQEGNIFKLPDCIIVGYDFVFTLSDDGQDCTWTGFQPTGYVHNTYGMVCYYLNDFMRDGNTLYFEQLPCVLWGGRYQQLYANCVEILEMPE